MQQIISRYFFPLIFIICLIILASCGGDSGSNDFFFPPNTDSDTNLEEITEETVEETITNLGILGDTVNLAIDTQLSLGFPDGFDPESFVTALNNEKTITTTTSDNLLTIAIQENLNYCTTYSLSFYSEYIDASEDPVNVTFNFTTMAPPGKKMYFLSPEGSNSNDGISQVTAFKTFAKAFSTMQPGDCLALDNGSYSEESGTGYINNTTENSAQIPSGQNLDLMTTVLSLNPGKVFISGPLIIGSESEKRSFIEVNGITFKNNTAEAGSKSSRLVNSSYVNIRNSGFHGGFSLGSNDHNDGNKYNLIEDVWIWGDELRHISHNYRSDYTTWRRVVIRGDGCNGFYNCDLLGKGDPSYGASSYNSNHVSFQNVMVVDRILGGGQDYADFIVAHHDNGSPEVPQTDDRTSHLEWLGTISLNSEDGGYYLEPDVGFIESPTFTIKNAIAWGGPGIGIYIRRDWDDTVISGITMQGEASQGVTLDFDDSIVPDPTGSVTNAIVTGFQRGISTTFQSSHVNVYNVGDSFPGASCSSGCLSFNPTAIDPDNNEAPVALKYLTRIEDGSTLDGTGFEGADIGATVLKRYGAFGSRACEDSVEHASCNTNRSALTSKNLWPWPNEDRIKSEMCVGVTRGFCSAGLQKDGENEVTLTSYVWEFLGNKMPAFVYSL